MFSELPVYVLLTFLLICGAVLLVFLRLILAPLISDSKKTLAILVCVGILTWLVMHNVLAFNHFYTASYELPPRGFLMIVPPFIVIFVTLFLLWKSEYFKHLSLSTMTHIHVFRFPLELIVFTGLFSAGFIPEVMTFYGRNLDILVGITAPLVGYLYFQRKKISRNVLLIWNIVSLLFLINISVHAVLSIPYPFQQFGIEQPNLAVLSFPFVLIPSLLVAVGYFCHIVSIHKILVFEK